MNLNSLKNIELLLIKKKNLKNNMIIKKLKDHVLKIKKKKIQLNLK